MSIPQAAPPHPYRTTADTDPAMGPAATVTLIDRTSAMKKAVIDHLLVEEPVRTKREREILDAAAGVFHEKGYVASSIQDVADAVGILKGSLYYYIDSKEDLLFGILVDTHHESMRRLAQWQQIEGDALTKLRAFIEGHLMANIANRVKIGVFLHDFRSLSPERRQAIIKDRDVYDGYVRTLIREGQEEGLVNPDADPKIVAMALMGMMNWIYQWYDPAHPGGVEPRDLARSFADFALAGLADRGVPASSIGAFPPGFEAVVGAEAMSATLREHSA